MAQPRGEPRGLTAAMDALAAIQVVGIEGMERSRGEAVVNQDASDWIELPAEVNTTGVYCRFGYDEAQVAQAMYWLKPPTGDGTFSEVSYRINIATFEDLGFEFYPGDVDNYLAYRWHEERGHRIGRRTDKWARENGCLYMGQGTPEQQKERRRQADLLGAIRRWAETRYIRGQRYGISLRAKLPEGWVFEAGEHHYGYWNYIVDREGFRIVAIFDKWMDGSHMGLLSVAQTKAQEEGWNSFYRDDDSIGYNDEGGYWEPSDPWRHGSRGLASFESVSDRAVLHRMWWRGDPRQMRTIVIARDGSVLLDEVVEDERAC